MGHIIIYTRSVGVRGDAARGKSVGCGVGGLWSGQVLDGSEQAVDVGVTSRDAPQARVGISWRDAADNLICLMIIRYLLRTVRGER